MQTSWQVKDPNGWRDVTAPFEWHNGRLDVDWPDDSRTNVSFQTVSYPVARVRQKPRGYVR